MLKKMIFYGIIEAKSESGCKSNRAHRNRSPAAAADLKGENIL